MLPVPPLLVISDRRQARQPLQQVVEAAFAGGCRWFSLREKDLPAEDRRALPGGLVALGRGHGAGVTAQQDAAAGLAAVACGIAVMGEAMRAADPQATIEYILRMMNSPSGATNILMK